LTAIAALASGSTRTEAAEKAGVDRRTLHRWRNQDPEFIAALNGLRSEAAEQVENELRGLATEAVATIRTLMSDSQAPAAVRLKAAWSVLEAVRDEHLGSDDPDEIRREMEDEAPDGFGAILGRLRR
jgi:transposase-like protein